MKQVLLRWGAAFFGSLFLCLQASATVSGDDPAVSVLKNIQHFVVQRDGSYVLESELLTQLHEERGVRIGAERTFGFNRTMEAVEILEAYVEKPDGRRIAVKPEQIRLEQARRSSGAAMFQDVQSKTIVFPDVAVGDKLYSRVRTTRHEAVFPGHFYDVTYPEFHPTTELRLTYDLPADMPLQATAEGFERVSVTQGEVRIVQVWAYVPAPNPRLEAGAVNYADFGRHLIVSTFKDYAEVGQAYERGAAGKAAVSAAIRAQAQTLTQGLQDPRAKALALANWVRKNIRYVAIYLGNGGLVPHEAASVLTNLYGDCKDHVTLLEALLAAIGIDSTPALINAGNAYKLSPVASLGQFDHVITYIPSLDLFLDSTAADLAPGYLPVSELGKPVLLTRLGEVRQTPLTQPGEIRNHYTVRIAADGSADFRFTRENFGLYEETTRWEQRNWKLSDRALAVENLLKSRGVKGQGTVELGPAEPVGQGYAFTLRGHAENWAYLPGTVGIGTDSSFYAGLAGMVFALTAEKQRTQPFVCPSDNVTEEATFEFAPDASVLVLPPDVRIASPYFEYRSSYRREAHSVRVDRRFKSGKAGSRVCSPEDSAAMQPDIARMVRDLRSQLILQQLEPR